MGYRRGCQPKGKYGKYKFRYLPEWDVYICPERCYLSYRTTTRMGYREYSADDSHCSHCPRREECLAEKQRWKVLRRHVWEDYRDKMYRFTKTDLGKEIYARRKETIERSFADSKELHGLRYCRMRGLEEGIRTMLVDSSSTEAERFGARACARALFIYLLGHLANTLYRHDLHAHLIELL